MKRLLQIALALAMLPCAVANAEMNGVLRIGVLNDMSSVYADFQGPGSVVAAQLAVEDFAKQSKRKVEVISADHQNKPDVGAGIARRWLDVEGVDMIIDMPNSAVALAVGDIVREKNKVAIGSGAGTSLLTGAKCSPNFVHWTYDTWAMGHSLARGVLAAGGKTWFIITADYAFGHDLEQVTAAVVREGGGRVLGSVRTPINTLDFSSALLHAQSSKAKVVGLANAGADTSNAIKQAAEFGIVRGGQKLAGLLVFINDINTLGLEAAQGMLLTNAFYWDRTEESRAWAQRYFQRMGKMPNMTQAGIYSATTHYLKAVEAAGTKETQAVMEKMRSTPINDFFVKGGKIREDGRMVHEMYLYEVKKLAESKGAWDYYKLVATIPAEEAFQPLSESKCPLVKKGQ